MSRPLRVARATLPPDRESMQKFRPDPPFQPLLSVLNVRSSQSGTLPEESPLLLQDLPGSEVSLPSPSLSQPFSCPQHCPNNPTHR